MIVAYNNAVPTQEQTEVFPDDVGAKVPAVLTPSATRTPTRSDGG